MRADILETTIGGITYQVENPLLSDGLKATVTALDDAGNLLASDRFNLDREKARSAFAEKAGTPAKDLLTVRTAVAEWLVPPPDTGPEPRTEPDPAAQEAAIALLMDPSLLDRAAGEVTTMGYAGETTLPKLVYLVLTSRLLARPLNLVVTGPSSAGKSFLVNLVAQLFPDRAVYHLSGMSERVLVYTDADLQHRMLIIGEASALHREGIGASLLRAVAWEGKLAYETVEKTADGLQARRIEKPGPTGFITTTTGKVEAELETRVLTVHIPDTPDTTRVILQATAGRANGHRPEDPDLEAWHALQWWLEEHGGQDVTIPFAEALADRVPSRLVRMRRDFTQILTLIQAHAMLYQLQRERTEDGRIIADHRDYEAVFALAADVFGMITAEGITPAIRETVAKVNELTPNPDDALTVTRLANEMGLDRSAVQKRVNRALDGGWLVNLETRRKRPAKLRGGDPMPEDRPALPTPYDLFTNMEVPQSHTRSLPHAQAKNSGKTPMSHTVPTVPLSEDAVGQWDISGTLAKPTEIPHAQAENRDSGNVGHQVPREAFSTPIISDLQRWLADGTILANHRPATRPDGRAMEAAKLGTYIPLWTDDLKKGGKPAEEALLWLEAAHAAISASFGVGKVA